MKTAARSLVILSWLGTAFLLKFLVCLSFPIERELLANGLVVLIEQNNASATTFLQVLVRGGKKAEPPGKRGLSFLATRLAVEIPDSSKAQELMGLASSFSVSSAEDYSVINIECLTDALEPTLRLLAQIITSPLFTGFRIDSIKKYMAHQSSVEKDDPLILGHLAALSAFFGNETGYGGSAYGDEKSLATIKNKDVSDFYRSSFTSSNVIISVCSDLNKETIRSLLDKTFGSLPPGKQVTPAPVPVRSPQEKFLVIPKETKQCLVSLCFPLPKIDSRRYAANELLANFLGKGSGSKLWPLRSEEKLAYSVNCRVTQMLEGGILEAYLETDPAKKEQALQSLKNILTRVSLDGLNEEELEAAKAVTKTNFLRDQELKRTRVATVGSFEMLGLGSDYWAGFLAELNSLTLSEVNSYLHQVLDLEKAIVVVVGPSR